MELKDDLAHGLGQVEVRVRRTEVERPFVRVVFVGGGAQVEGYGAVGQREGGGGVLETGRVVVVVRRHGLVYICR